VQRLVRGLAELGDAVPAARTRLVVNRLRRGAVGPDPRGQLAEAMQRYAGAQVAAFLPDDRDAFDAALLQARPLREVAPGSAVRAALRELAVAVAADLGLVTAPVRRTRRSRRRVAGSPVHAP
jgi:Flp pilus assembly CpaE family ATPase